MAKTSRRTVLGGIAATPVALAPAVSSARPSELLQLIDAHRAAFQAFSDACKKEDELCFAYREEQRSKPEVVIPCLLGGVISIWRVQADCRTFIADAFETQRKRLEKLAQIAPEAADQMRKALDAKEIENLALVDSAFEEERARREAFGLEAATRQRDAANDADEAALIAVCAYVCSTAEEGRIKSEYLAEMHEQLDGFQQEHVLALLQSIAGGANV